MKLARPTRALPAAALLLAACSDAPRVGVVDVQAAYQHSPLMMVSALEIKKELGKTDRELKQRGRALAEMRQQLEHGDAGDAEAPGARGAHRAESASRSRGRATTA